MLMSSAGLSSSLESCCLNFAAAVVSLERHRAPSAYPATVRVLTKPVGKVSIHSSDLAMFFNDCLSAILLKA